MTPALTFATAWIALHAGLHLADHWLQTQHLLCTKRLAVA
ncbi:hypothetical protein DFJ69_5821 [Thermomonospora umbrina]|uniref:Uncharacterized protein n=1 Tax=Thermomonospora umbrina TaxID=111806 RepID=A0A3D9T0G9_9ACTN|nr:hypothetical protein DFJ69_5821 [Thermomonospora umbrina]